MKTVVSVVDELILLVKSDENLWNPDEEARKDPSYKGFKNIYNNRFFTGKGINEESFPILSIDVAPTFCQKTSDGSATPYACQVIIQTYSLLGESDAEISVSRGVSIDKMYEVLDCLNAMPFNDKIDMFEDYIETNPVTSSACVVEKNL